MSLEKKIAVGLLSLSSAALSGCKKNSHLYLGGVAISEAVTDSKGKAEFIDAESEEEVTVEVDIMGTAYPISDARVT